MQIPKGHNHDDWVSKHTNCQADWNVKKMEWKGAAVIYPLNTLTKRKAVSYLALSSSFKSDLEKKLQLSDRDTQDIVDSAMVDASNEDSNVESLKY